MCAECCVVDVRSMQYAFNMYATSVVKLLDILPVCGLPATLTSSASARLKYQELFSSCLIKSSRQMLQKANEVSSPVLLLVLTEQL